MRDDLDLAELDRALRGEDADPELTALVEDVRAVAPRPAPAAATRLHRAVTRLRRACDAG